MIPPERLYLSRPRVGHFPAELLNVSGHMHRLDAPEFIHPLLLAPAQEGPGSSPISGPRVRAADIDGKELDEAPRGPLPCPGGSFFRSQ
jgi:hypothetical protein